MCIFLHQLDVSTNTVTKTNYKNTSERGREISYHLHHMLKNCHHHIQECEFRLLVGHAIFISLSHKLTAHCVLLFILARPYSIQW